MDLQIWIPTPDRAAVLREAPGIGSRLLSELPLNYDNTANARPNTVNTECSPTTQDSSATSSPRESSLHEPWTHVQAAAFTTAPCTPPAPHPSPVGPAVRTPVAAPTSAADRHVQGAAFAAATASRLVTLADTVDSLLYGKRAKVLVGTAAVVVFTPTAVGWVDGPSWVEPLVAMSFVLLTATLAVARIAMFRDEDGRWAPSIGLSNLREEGNDLRERLNTYRGLGANQRL